MCRFYGWTEEVVFDLPLKNFTLHNTNIDRLRAEEDSRLAQIMMSANSGDAAKALFDKLREEQGSPMVFVQEAPDEGAIQKLKALKNRK